MELACDINKSNITSSHHQSLIPVLHPKLLVKQLQPKQSLDTNTTCMTKNVSQNVLATRGRKIKTDPLAKMIFITPTMTRITWSI